MTVIKELFTEKFRPKGIADLIAPPRIKEELSKGLIQNVLLTGSPGTGKTSTLFILAKDHTTKFINASSERGIDTIRNDIEKFCASMSLMGNKEQLKCVILDEFDGATPDFYMAIKAVIEKYAKVTRFVASCNFLPKIPDAVQSRFHIISYDPINKEEEKYQLDEYKKRVSLILNKIGIVHTDEILEKFIKSNFPDMRDIMNKLQSFYLRGIKELNEGNFHAHFDFENLFELCCTKPDKPHNNYKFVMSNYGNKVDEALIALGAELPDYIHAKHPHLESKIPMILIAMADYQYQKAFTIDTTVTLLAAIFKLQTILS